MRMNYSDLNERDDLLGKNASGSRKRNFGSASDKPEPKSPQPFVDDLFILRGDSL